MSAPDTNTPKQARRHRPALLALAAAVIFGLVMFMAIGFEATDDAADPASSAPMQSAPDAGAPEVGAPEVGATVTETPDATERVPHDAAPAATPEASTAQPTTGQ